MTSTTTAAVSTWSTLPTLENNFDLYIGDEYHDSQRGTPVWKNPHLNAAITPYVPSDDNQALLASCQRAFQNLNVFVDVTPEALLTTNDLSVVIFSQLDAKSLSRCSKVCKSFYLITKHPILWDNLFATCFKNVKPFSSEVCIYSPQQQFQIIYKKINDHKKPFFAKFDHLQEKCFGYYKQLTPLIIKFKEFGGDDAANDAMTKIRENTVFYDNVVSIDIEKNSAILSQLYGSDGYKAYLLQQKINNFTYGIGYNVGQKYDGTVESIDPNSFLGRILTAIEQFIPDAFDNQEKFEDVIRQSEASKNTTSLNDGPVVEDVTDVADAQTE